MQRLQQWWRHGRLNGRNREQDGNRNRNGVGHGLRFGLGKRFGLGNWVGLGKRLQQLQRIVLPWIQLLRLSVQR
jgi:ADP-heptose:LPS heptosyltransferase